MRSDRGLSALVIGALIVSLAGCATTSEPVSVIYKPSSDRTTYRTERVRLDAEDVTSGLQQDVQFFVQVVGTCRGNECAPRTYSLKFIKGGTQPIRLGGREIRLEVGTETITWDDPQTRDAGNMSEIRGGTFVTVEVSTKQLATIGSVSEVSGSMGSTSFDLSYDRRAPIRTLISKIEGQLDSSSDDEGVSSPDETSGGRETRLI